MRDEKRNAPLEMLDGGFAVFRGAELCGGKPKNTVTAEISGGHLTVVSEFSDGNSRSFECDFELAGSGDSARLYDMTEYINGVPLTP